MTIIECIMKADNQKPNQYSTEDKVSWLSSLDYRVRTEVVDTHTLGKDSTDVKPPLPPFVPYTTDMMSQNLIADFPYDEMYVAYIKAKIDEMNEETTRYNNSATIFNSLYTDFCKAYNKAHEPLCDSFLRVK